MVLGVVKGVDFMYRRGKNGSLVVELRLGMQKTPDSIHSIFS